jgi:nucleoside-diphosphate-sugar epimerase
MKPAGLAGRSASSRSERPQAVRDDYAPWMTEAMSTLDHDESLGEGTILFGGSGFLGPYILENYPGIVSVGRSPCPNRNRHIHVDSLADLSALADVAFDKVIFIVGNTDHHAMEREHLEPQAPTAFDHHVMPFIQVAEQIKHRKISKFIHFSTALIYDEARIKLPVSENSPINPYRNRYVMSKYIGEELCKFYRNWMPIINCRMCNLYGPTPLERFDLIHVLTRKLVADGQAEVWSTRPARDFIYVEDAAHAIVKLLYSSYNSTVLLGSGLMTKVRTVVDYLAQISGCTITSREQPVSGPLEFRADLTTLHSIIDWIPRIPIEEGIRRTFEFERRRRAS